MTISRFLLTALCATCLVPATAAPAHQAEDERPAQLRPVPAPDADFTRRTVEIPMRDGVTLHTVILIPNGAKDAGILLTRTPYDAEGLTRHADSGRMASVLQGYDNAADVIAAGGYIRVVQDVRGKYGSGGTYMMNRALAGTDANSTAVDHATDTWDTIDWLVKNLPQSNGRVGMIGISYDGFTTLMGLVGAHPALKVAVPMNPMVDGWRGDDWFHNGAFRLNSLPYFFNQEASRDGSAKWQSSTYDDYDVQMRAGSAGALAQAHGLDQVGIWRKVADHPAYDAYWQDQAMDRVLARRGSDVPTMLVHSLWDQEDIYGAMAVYRALRAKPAMRGKLFLSIGPWFHGQGIGNGNRLGAIDWDADTAKQWRRDVLAPFLAHYLKDAAMDVAPVTAFQSGTNRWQRLGSWPSGEGRTRLYLRPGMTLGFDAAPGKDVADYVSDPAVPVTYQPRPVPALGYGDNNPWPTWLTGDQRAVSGRPDVLTFTGPVLTKPLAIAGEPVVHLTAATTGTDSDWVVKLIDVYPDEVPETPAMGGYQLAVAMDIFRGRYRESLAQARAITPGRALPYTFALPTANHVFLPGHRIMVQVQSSWFPLYDRNPQTFVPNIFFARPGDYRAANQSITIAGAQASYISLPTEKD
ncbi:MULTISPECIES: CocE/NonD family hydrolase [Sphingomonas]|uniref:Glutaryl-7-ACA acylase n=1 Tax=Sphingomonas adhaesiva TaxID=28212 RepID=A0A2A4IB27_9SPHN|nr:MULTISPECIES: CocE/NonD family hydrolase [Sphingomonas]PCG14992.1 glutaryl-7-ACA acylase [Sphingomonas adhaesiva]PZU81309.1 MAG: glutaryl-7-ACA acylase [Sphingomonas sp.]